MKNQKQKELLLEQLKKIPIIHIACEKSGISRATYYRWLKEDKQFGQQTETAIAEGEALITDMTESQLISLIHDRNFQALQLWLRHHHPKYSQKLEITANIQTQQDELTPEQEAVVKEALRLASLLPEEQLKENNQLNNDDDNTQLPTITPETQLPSPSAQPGGADDKRP